MFFGRSYPLYALISQAMPMRDLAVSNSTALRACPLEVYNQYNPSKWTCSMYEEELIYTLWVCNKAIGWQNATRNDVL
jgi:hypothetical protein